MLLGQIAEARSNEPLPFSYIAVDGRFVVSDLKGSFSYQASGDSVIRNEVGLKADSSGFRQTNLNTEVSRINGYLQDHITWAGQVDFKLGFRADIPFNLNMGFLYIEQD